jgi:flagellar biosynthesis component FlhA
LEVGAPLAGFFQEGKEREEGEKFLTGILYQNYGVWGLTVQVIPVSSSLAEYQILFRGTPTVRYTHDPAKRLVTGPPGELAIVPLPSEPGENPANGLPARWIRVDDARKLSDGTVTAGPGVVAWDVPGYVYLHLYGCLRRNLDSVLELDALARMVEGAGTDACKELAQDDDRLLDFLHVARVLLSEDVPLLPLETVVAQFQKSWRPNGPLCRVVEEIRSLPELKATLPGADASYRLLPISQDLEDLLMVRVFDSETEPFLAIEPEVCQQVLAAVRRQVSNLEYTAAVVVRASKLRGLLRRLVRLEFPNLFVIAQGELEPTWESRVALTIEYDSPVPLRLRLERNEGGSARTTYPHLPEAATETVTAWLDLLEESRPRLVKLARQRFSGGQLAAAVECLSKSGVPVGNLALVLDGLLSVRSVLGYSLRSVIVFAPGLGILSQDTARSMEELSIAELAEAARQAMTSVISYRYAPQGNLRCLLVHPDIEGALSDPSQAEDEDVLRRLIEAVRKEWGLLKDPGCVLLTAIEVRSKLEEILRGPCDGLAVVAYQDLSPHLNVTPLARVNW